MAPAFSAGAFSRRDAYPVKELSIIAETNRIHPVVDVHDPRGTGGSNAVRTTASARIDLAGTQNGNDGCRIGQRRPADGIGSVGRDNGDGCCGSVERGT